MSDQPDVGSTRAEAGTGIDSAGVPEGVATDPIGNPDLDATPGESVFTPEEKADAAEKKAFGDVDHFKSFRADDGALDEEKAANAYYELRTKLSKGGTVTAPETADAYTFDFGDVPVDEAQASAFKEEAHKAGLSQEQYEFVMSKYVSEMQTVTQSFAGPTAEEAQETLTNEWGDDFQGNMQAAARAWKTFGTGDVDKVGNNVEVLQLLAAIGSQLGEDDFQSQNMRSDSASNVLTNDDLTALRSREDYWTNPEVQKRVRDHYAAQLGEDVG